MNMNVNEPFEPEIVEPEPRSPIWGPWPTVGLGTAILVLFVIVQMVIGIVFMAIWLATNPGVDITDMTQVELMASNGLMISLATFASAIVCGGFIVLFIKIRRGASIKDYLGLRSIGIWTIIVLLVMALAFTIIESLIAYNLDITSSGQDLLINAYKTSVWPPLFWIAVVVFAPLFEEMFFRGFLFTGLQRSRIGIIGTILVTSIIWTLLHVFNQYNAFQMTTIFLMGILLGVVRYRTGSLWSVLLIHAFWNLLATIALVLTINGVI